MAAGSRWHCARPRKGAGSGGPGKGSRFAPLGRGRPVWVGLRVCWSVDGGCSLGYGSVGTR
eukprot:3935868-Rhodomonas_salina.1